MQIRPDFKAESRILAETVRPYAGYFLLLIVGAFLSALFDGISIGTLVVFLNNSQAPPDDPGQQIAFLAWIGRILAPYGFETQLLLGIGLVVGAILLKNVFLTLAGKLSRRITSWIVIDLRGTAVKLLLEVSIGFHRRSKTGDLVTRAVEFTVYIQALIQYMVTLIIDLLTFLVLFLLLLLLSWQLTLVTVCLGLLLGLALSKYTRRLKPLGKQLALQNRDLYATMYESLNGIELIKSFGQEKPRERSLRNIISRQQEQVYRLQFRTFLIHPFTEVLGILGLGGLMAVALLLYEMNTHLLLTRLVPFLYILNRCIPVLKSINLGKAEIVNHWPYLSMFYDLLRRDDKEFILNGRETFPGLRKGIRFQDVTFTYRDTSQQVLNKANFYIPAGKTTAIVGESGAGKSTIASLLLRFFDPTEGQILIGGTPLPQLDLTSYYRRIGVVSQDTFLFNDTVRNNLMYGLGQELSENEIRSAAEKAGAHEFITALPQGYDTLLGERGMKLSGGQRQRISIARTILRDPEILILDEATSSLDMKTEQLIHQAVFALSRNRTVIIIAHRLSTVKDADQIIVLKDGRVIESGKPAELYHQKGAYYRLANTDH